MKVEVTENNILCGDRYSNKTCPIALALRYGHGARFISVFPTEINFKIKGEPFRFVPPPEAGKFMWDFDHRNPVKPFVFELK